MKLLAGCAEHRVAALFVGRDLHSSSRGGARQRRRSKRPVRQTKLLRVARGALLLAAWGLWPNSVLAADVSVRVQEGDGGQPIERAAVCLGTPGDVDQFGAFLTPPDGTVVYADIPQTELLLTVSKPGFRGEKRLLPLLEYQRILTVALSRGGFGPVCQATAPFVEPKTGGLRVESFKINAGQKRTDRRRVTLNFSVQGSPTDYRASEMPDLADADWQAFTPNPQFDLTSGPGEKRVYVQVRKYQQSPAGTVQMVSQPVSDAIWLTR